jgi:DNA-binding NarL/FixJ family response regulator
MQPIRIAIFEDEHITREMLKDLVNSTRDMECTGDFADAQDLISKVEAAAPSVILMDIEMPGMNGIEAVRVIKENFPSIHIVMQTVYDDDDRIFQSICAGASGYLLKGTPAHKILEALNEALLGGSPFSPGVAGRIIDQFRKQSVPSDLEISKLSDRELEILQYMVGGMSNKLIADRCFISTNTVKFHIRNIYEKLQVNSKGSAIAQAIKRKLI